MAIKIFVDQGHNPYGHNTGAQNSGINEQDITYNVGIYLDQMLTANPEFEVRLSRPAEDTVLGTNNATSLKERVDMANKWPADYFISIHANSNVNPAIEGTEVYVYKAYTESYYLAEHVLKGIVDVVGTKDNGVRINPSLYVLRRTRMPAILVELAYLSNFEDRQRLIDEQYAFAEGIYDGLLTYFGLANR